MVYYFISMMMGNYIHYISKNRYWLLKMCTSIIFVECTEIICIKQMKMYCAFLLLIKDMGRYLGVIGNLHNYSCLIYIFTYEVIDVDSNILINSQYCCWFKQLMDEISPVLNNTTNYNVHFLNQV